MCVFSGEIVKNKYIITFSLLMDVNKEALPLAMLPLAMRVFTFIFKTGNKISSTFVLMGEIK